jgi:PAS domain S-box-containing protein
MNPGRPPSAEELRAQLVAIIESSDDAIIGKTPDGTITSWNRGAERLYGYSAIEAIGRPITMIMPPELPDEFPSIMARLLRGERVEHYETVRVHKDGRRLDVSVTISPIKDLQGRVVGASAIATSARRSSWRRSAPHCWSASRQRAASPRRRTAPRTNSSPRSRTSCARR